MNITEIYNEIIDRLNNAGYEVISADLDRFLDAASTGGEGLETTAGYLGNLKKNNSAAYALVKDLIILYVQYCRQHGVFLE